MSKKLRKALCGIVAFLLLGVSCSSIPSPRENYSLLAISALLPVPNEGVYYKSRKLILCRVEGRKLNSSAMFLTDDVNGDLFYSYNLPPGCYAVVGCVAETPVGEMNERLVFVFRKESALRSVVCVGERAVHFGGRLQFDYLPYDDFIADDFQRRVLKWFNPLILTEGAYPLNNIIFRYKIYMAVSAFIDPGMSPAAEQSMTEYLGDGPWSSYLRR